tara:strand:- start:311 stop:601 length:291 start_codon:yes stop_codon:yes gene_type:complete
MSKIQKLTEDELKKVQDIRKNYVTIQNTFGQLHLTKLNLENQLSQINVNYETLTTEYTKTQEAERTLVQSIQDKYGQGTLNIGDGTFTPTEDSENS